MLDIKRWTEEKANLWQQKTGWLLGFNYVPSSAINSTEMWQAGTYDKERIKTELELAAQAGFNSCRVFLQYLVWEKEGDNFIKTFSDFCQVAHESGLSVMPILFDDCNFAMKEPYLGPQDPPRHGVSNSGWTPCPGSCIADDPSKEQNLREYVKTVVGAFKDNPQIVIWDIYNEPGACGRGEKSLSLFTKAFQWAREAEPMQPLTSAIWDHTDKAVDFGYEKISDVISFHDYMALDDSDSLVNRLQEYKRPIFCTEWLCRQGGNTFESHLPLYKRETAGAYNWGLILGKTQTNLHGSTIFGEPDPNPDPWQHDLFYPDFKPYKEEEIEFLKRVGANLSN